MKTIAGRTHSRRIGFTFIELHYAVGTLTTMSETWAAGGRLRLEINDIDAGAGLGWDFVNINGALSLTATTGSKFTLKIDSLTLVKAAVPVGDFHAANDYSWRFLTANGGITGFNASAFAFELSGFQNALTGAFSVNQSGKDLFLNYTAVPEPSSALLAAVGALIFLNRHGRSARNHH